MRSPPPRQLDVPHLVAEVNRDPADVRTDTLCADDTARRLCGGKTQWLGYTNYMRLPGKPRTES